MVETWPVGIKHWVRSFQSLAGEHLMITVLLVQEGALRFLLNDQKSSYHELLEKCNYTTMLIRRIKTITIEVFKSFLKEMFNIKELKYSLRDSHIIYQPKFEKVTYGKNTFK